jgi:ligand-binding sensor domain-containing protein
MYPNNDLSSVPMHILKDYSVSRVFQDKSTNYWFSTTEKGVFLVPSFDFKSFNNQNLDFENEIVYSIAVKKNKMFASTNNKKLFSFQIDNDLLYNKKDVNLEGGVFANINDVFVDTHGTLWITGSEYLHYTDQGKRIVIDTINNKYGYEFIESSDHKIFMAIQNGFNVYKNSNRYYPNIVDMVFDRTFTIHEGLNGRIWMGNLYGVFIYENDICQKFKENDPVLSTRISDITSVDNQMWIGTFDNGMAVLNGDSIIYINESNGLSSNRVKVIYIEDDKNIWVGTNNGLNHIVITDDQIFKFHIDFFTIWDGLPSNEINDILQHEEVMWLGTDRGLVSFYPKEISKIYCMPSMYFESKLTYRLNQS